MVMREENQMYVGQVVEINGRIGPPRACHPWPKVYVISSVEEIGLPALSSRPWDERNLGV